VSLINEIAARADLLSVAVVVIALPFLFNVVTGNGLVKSIPVVWTIRDFSFLFQYQTTPDALTRSF
jgi:hypothetical protein